MPQRTQRGFLHGFAQGRVSVDGAGDVFQASPHFQRLAEGRGQLRNTGAHCLPTENQVVVTPRNNPHESAF